MNLDELIFRASSVPKLMGKTGLGVTGQKAAIEAYIAQSKRRFKDIKSKYLEKGIENESNAIELFNELTGKSYEKNKTRLNNDFLTGECDIDTGFDIIDIKCSWDIFTFYDSVFAYNHDYEYQLRAYMELYDRPEASVIFCLTDTPNHMILNQMERESFKYGGDLPDLIAIKIITNSIFDKDNFHEFLELAPIDLNKVKNEIDRFVHIPKEDRIHAFKYVRDEKKTDLMYSRIKDARNFLKIKLDETGII